MSTPTPHSAPEAAVSTETAEHLTDEEMATGKRCPACQPACTTCGGVIIEYGASEYGEPMCSCDQLRNIADLKSFGYEQGVGRIAGGRFALRRPDGTVVVEHEFTAELNRLLSA